MKKIRLVLLITILCSITITANAGEVEKGIRMRDIPRVVYDKAVDFYHWVFGEDEDKKDINYSKFEYPSCPYTPTEPENIKVYTPPPSTYYQTKNGINIPAEELIGLSANNDRITSELLEKVADMNGRIGRMSTVSYPVPFNKVYIPSKINKKQGQHGKQIDNMRQINVISVFHNTSLEPPEPKIKNKLNPKKKYKSIERHKYYKTYEYPAIPGSNSRVPDSIEDEVYLEYLKEGKNLLYVKGSHQGRYYYTYSGSEDILKINNQSGEMYIKVCDVFDGSRVWEWRHSKFFYVKEGVEKAAKYDYYKYAQYENLLKEKFKQQGFTEEDAQNAFELAYRDTFFETDKQKIDNRFMEFLNIDFVNRDMLNESLEDPYKYITGRRRAGSGPTHLTEKDRGSMKAKSQLFNPSVFDIVNTYTNKIVKHNDGASWGG